MAAKEEASEPSAIARVCEADGDLAVALSRFTCFRLAPVSMHIYAPVMFSPHGWREREGRTGDGMKTPIEVVRITECDLLN